jgi:hypothetical protein
MAWSVELVLDTGYTVTLVCCTELPRVRVKMAILGARVPAICPSSIMLVCCTELPQERVRMVIHGAHLFPSCLPFTLVRHWALLLLRRLLRRSSPASPPPEKGLGCMQGIFPKDR